MAEEKDMTAVETNVVNPKQAVNVLENSDKVTSYETPTFTLQSDNKQFKFEENTSFFNSEAWKDYQSDMMRAFKPYRYPVFDTIERVSSSDLWRSSVDAYGDAVINRAQSIHSTYKRANNAFTRGWEAYNAQRYNLRLAAARKDLSDAIIDGNEKEILEAKIKYQNEQKNLYERGQQYDDSEWGNTVMSVAAGMARNWETIPISVIGEGLLGRVPYVGPAFKVGARALNMYIVGQDTYRLEAGGMLQRLDEEAPYLTEQEKHERVVTPALGSAVTEAGLFGAGLNLGGKAVKRVGTAVTERALKKTVTETAKKAGTELTADAAKEATKSLVKTDLIKTLQNPAAKNNLLKTLKEAGIDTVVGGLTEGGQEVFQDSLADAMIRSVQNGTTLTDEMLDDWTDFLVDPLGPQHAEKWKTFINVALASPLFAGASHGAAIGIKHFGNSHSGLGDAYDKLTGMRNNSLGLSMLFKQQGEADAKSANGVAHAVLQEHINKGEISGKLYTTVDQVKKMQEDPEVAEALEQMGIAKALEEADENGGVVELDLLAYDKIVNQSQNTVLFQKMRNYLSFSDTTMSVEEYNQFIKDSGKKVAGNLSEDVRNDKNSIYNKFRDMFLKAGYDEDEADGYGAVAQFVLSNAKGFTKDKVNDIMDRMRVTIEGKNGGVITQKFNEALSSSVMDEVGNRTVNFGDAKNTAITFNKITKGKDKGKYTVGITDNTGLSSVMKDTGGWSTAEEKAKAAVFETEAEAQAAVQTMYAKTEGDGVTLDVGAAFDAVFAENAQGDTKEYHMTIGEKEAGRTTMAGDQYEIRLTPNANATTFAHEIFHMFSLELQRVYNNGTITDYWKKQADKMFKLVDAEPQVDPVDPTVFRYILTEAQEEKLANMFTTYLMKGKIENPEIRGMLAKLIEMFRTIYRQSESRDLTEKALNKKAYEFFNSVVSTQDAIEEIQRNAGLLEIAEPAGVDRELYDYYIANIAASKVEASNDLRRKLYKIDEYRKSPEYTKKMQAFKDAAKAELLEEDRYKILAQASLFEGEDKASQVLLWTEKNMPEANYTIGDIEDILANTPSLEEASTAEAERMMEAHIAKEYKLTPQDIGFKEERNRAKVRALLAEAVMRRGGTIKDMEAEIKKADLASDKHLAKTSVYQILKLDKWKDREAAAVERYAWAKQNGRDDLMAAERYNQAVLNLIMIKANGYKAEYQNLTSLFQKLQGRQKKYKDPNTDRTEHRYHAEDWELLRSISEKFGNKIRDGRRSEKTVHQQLKDWIQTQVDNRFTTVAGLEDYIEFIDRGFDGSIGAMTGRDFKKLWAVMHTIDSIAMREQQLYLDGQYAQASEFAKETIDFYNKMKIDTEGKTFLGTSGKFLGKYGTWTNPEPLLRAVFPPKVFQKIFLPMINGAFKAEAQAKIWIDRWKAAKGKINTSNEVFVLDDGTQITYGDKAKKALTYGDVTNILIAMGAEHSYENHKLKYGLTDEQMQMIASQAIKRNKAYVEFMNETWKVYGEATEKLNDSFQERTNELFVKKEHRAFEVDGIKFEGGYVPEDKHYIALVRELGTWNQGTQNKRESKNEKLITAPADGNILSIIDITETKLSQSAKWAYAAMPYNNVKKFVERPDVNEVIGERIYSFIRDWLQAWDTPHFDESGIWRPLTRATTIAALGMRASTALLQVSGIVQSASYIGMPYLMRGMVQFVREGGFFHPFKLPQTKSLYMATRVGDPFATFFGGESQGRTFKEILASYNKKTMLGKTGAALLSMYQSVAMMGIQLIDGWVATITWNGAYRKALDQGMTEEQAKLEADSVVRITQSDASQISRSTAMQEPWARAVTGFATWTMAMRSQTEALMTSKSYRKDLAIWVLSYGVLSTFIEAVLKEMTEPADEGEEDKEMLERIMNSWYNKMVESVGTQALPFAGLGSEAAKGIAAGLFNTDDDKMFQVFSGGNVSALQYASRMVTAARQGLTYMRTGDEEDRDKFIIQSSGLISYELKKRVKQIMED